MTDIHTLPLARDRDKDGEPIIQVTRFEHRGNDNVEPYNPLTQHNIKMWRGPAGNLEGFNDLELFIGTAGTIASLQNKDGFKEPGFAVDEQMQAHILLEKDHIRKHFIIQRAS